MSVQTTRPNNGLLPLLSLLTAVAVVAVLWWPVVVLAQLQGQRHVPLNPAAVVAALGVNHTLRWPGPSVFIAYGAQLIVISAVAVYVLTHRTRLRRGRTRVDASTRHLATTTDMVGLTPAQIRTSAQRLRPGADLSTPDSWGVLVGETVLSRTPLRMSWEDTMVMIAGPRVGKSTTSAIPAVVGYRGPLKTSSNKPDVHDATRGVRDDWGHCWLLDPQHLVDPDVLRLAPGPSTAAAIAPWWWNPLADVTTMSIARELVQILIDCSTGPDARTDAYFHPTGKTLLISYVFAAAVGGHSLLDVAEWLRNTDNRTAVKTLQSRGYGAAAGEILSVLAKPDRQRDGVLGTAQSWLSVLAEPNYAAWITPPERADVAEFSPAAFVRSAADTVYLLSQEGPASAAAITTLLNASIDRAALAYAATLPGRRLTNPVMSVLDEAANTIRDTRLPDDFSHHGSKGLPKIVFLQSWSQGEEVWGERGMRKMWSAANVKYYAGGVSETEFLKTVSDQLGPRDERYWLSSSSRDGRGGNSRSTSEQVRQVPIMDVAALAALPRGRAVMFSSGNRPALLRTVPWMTGSMAADIEASLARYEPGGRREDRLAETQSAAAEVATADAAHTISAADAASLNEQGVLL